jgi:hypothetical protein
MGDRIQPLLDAAKRLSLQEREALLDALLQLDARFEPDQGDIVEWNRRAAELETGTVDGLDADAAIAAVRADLKSRRSE